MSSEKTTFLPHPVGVDGPSRPRTFKQLGQLLLVATGVGLLWNQSATGWPTFGLLNRGPIDWKSCGGPVQCGRLDVPLDYFNSSKGFASLSVSRIPATDREQYLGILFVNPGGPGGSGVEWVKRGGEKIHNMLDGRYDIVSWDPRGVGGTFPKLSCFSSETAQTLFTHRSPMRFLELGNLSDHTELAVFKQQVAHWDARIKMAGQLCQKNALKALGHMDTATVARDLERLSSVLAGPQVPINYWGFSYGTELGSTWVNMFPHRVGRAIIDGVLDPEAWAHSQFSDWTAKHSMVDIMKAFRNFAAACAKAGPRLCALATKGATAESVEATIDNLLAQLRAKPLPVFDVKFPDLISASDVQQILFMTVYAPAVWPGVAALLGEVAAGNGTRLLTQLGGANVELNVTKAAESQFAFNQVVCSDAPELSAEAADSATEKLQNEIVRMYEEDGNKYFATGILNACHAWPVRAPKRFAGPFNHTLSNPILVIGNTADPVTPLRNAMHVNKLLGNSSRLIIQDSTGHCSSSTASLCTSKAIRAYMLNGTLPENGLFCEPSELPFPSGNTSDVALLLSDSDRTEENERILKIATEISKDWHENINVFF